MKLVTTITVRVPCHHVIDGRLYRLVPGDVLTVASSYADKHADITAHDARRMLQEHVAEVPGEEDLAQ